MYGLWNQKKKGGMNNVSATYQLEQIIEANQPSVSQSAKQAKSGSASVVGKVKEGNVYK